MNKTFEQLTGLRHFAALLVFLSHLRWEESSPFLVKIFESGYVGVSFFFLLSGFVLSFAYSKKIINNSLSFSKYALLRLVRLSPLHFLTALPFVLYSLYNSDLHYIKLLLNILYLQSWVPNSNYYFSFNGPSWSLSNEMFFYICFFFLTFMEVNKLFNILILLLFTILTSAFFVEFFLIDQKFFGNHTLAHWIFYIFPGFRLLEFILGMLLFKIWEAGFRLPSWTMLPSYIILVILMYFAEKVPEPFRMSLYFLPAIVLFFYSHLCETGFFVRFFSKKIMVLLGNASFSFYLIHQIIIGFLKRILRQFELSNFSFFLLSYITICIISIAMYVIYERKVESYLKSLIIKRIG